MIWLRGFRRLAKWVRRRGTGKPSGEETIARRESSSRRLPRWPGGEGPALQFPGATGADIDLVVGLDFGTSCTKAFVRSPFAFGSRATAVRWCGGAEEHPYLLPTVLYETSAGFDAEGGDVHTHTSLKVDLMDNPGSQEIRVRAAAYLGLALRAARQWFLDSQREIYGTLRVRWSLNLGIPSAGYDDDSVREAFLAVARAAWWLSLCPAPPTGERAKAAFVESKEGMDSLVPVDVVPEIAAEVVGYARSKERREGLHVMVDVGASTVDICGFVLSPADGDGEDQHLLLTALVERLGLQELHLRRACAVKEAGGQLCPGVAGALSPVAAIPDRGREYVDPSEERLREQLDRIDENYTQECREAIMTVLMDLRRCRDPLSPHWESGLPVFVGGGGGGFSLVTEALDRAHEALRNSLVDAPGIIRNSLPALGTLSNSDTPADMAGRLDVAYGLSFDRPDIGKIVPPDRIEDVKPPPARKGPEPVTKENV